MTRRTLAADEILKNVATEIGLRFSASPFSDTGDEYRQLRTLINTCGNRLMEEYNWQGLTLEHVFFTQPGISDYALPPGFVAMIDQSGWDRTTQVPLFGPTSEQSWQYLLGRKLVTYTIYVTFRINEGILKLFPQPPLAETEIAYEYRSDHWVIDADGSTTKNTITGPGDIPQFPAYLLERLLKLLFLTARGFDTTRAQAEFDRSLSNNQAMDKGAPLLNAGRHGWQYPLLDPIRNTPDTGFGVDIP